MYRNVSESMLGSCVVLRVYKTKVWTDLRSAYVLVRLTYTSGQYVAPHSPASSQACDLAASLKSVAMETREGQ